MEYAMSLTSFMVSRRKRQGVCRCLVFVAVRICFDAHGTDRIVCHGPLVGASRSGGDPHPWRGCFPRILCGIQGNARKHWCGIAQLPRHRLQQMLSTLPASNKPGATDDTLSNPLLRRRALWLSDIAFCAWGCFAADG